MAHQSIPGPEGRLNGMLRSATADGTSSNGAEHPDPTLSLSRLLEEVHPEIPQTKNPNTNTLTPSEVTNGIEAQSAGKFEMDLDDDIVAKAEPVEPNVSFPDNDEVPQCLIFGNDAGPHEVLIPMRHLQKLPKDVLRKILSQGESLGNFHRLGSTPHCESLIRVKQFLDHGDYTPFKPYTALEYIDSSGATQSWPVAKKDTPNAVASTKGTHALFLKEIDLYLYAAELGYSELLKVSCERICTKYPKSPQGILALIERVYDVAAKIQDTHMMSRIQDYTNANCKELTKLPAFVRLLRSQLVAKPPLGPLLLEAYISSSDGARRELAQKEPASPQTPAIKRPPPPRPASTNLASALPALVEALSTGALVVAPDNGYGTLLVNGRMVGRNTDFHFARGELLVTDLSTESHNSRNNILVTNSRGEKGDILKTLVKSVPMGLGAFRSEGDGVNCGASSDREGRAHRSKHGSRSRSPFRRF